MIKNFHFWDYKLEPPEPWEPPEWALEEIGILDDWNNEIYEQLRDYEALVNRYLENDDTEVANVYEYQIMDLEEQRYENQMRIAELEDASSEIYNPPPEGD